MKIPDNRLTLCHVMSLVTFAFEVLPIHIQTIHPWTPLIQKGEKTGVDVM